MITSKEAPQIRLEKTRKRHHSILMENGLGKVFSLATALDPVKVDGLLIVRQRLAPRASDELFKQYPALEDSYDIFDSSIKLGKVIGLQCILPGDKAATSAAKHLCHIALSLPLGPQDELFPALPNLTLDQTYCVKDLADELHLSRNQQDKTKLNLNTELVAYEPFITKTENWMI